MTICHFNLHFDQTSKHSHQLIRPKKFNSNLSLKDSPKIARGKVTTQFPAIVLGPKGVLILDRARKYKK